VHVQPAEGVAETNVTPAGNVNTKFVVAVVFDGPRFFTCIEYVRADETNTGVGDTDMAIAMSELPAGSTRMDVTEVLLLGVGSVSCDVTVAEF
jgi:hypothetical protein